MEYLFPLSGGGGVERLVGEVFKAGQHPLGWAVFILREPKPLSHSILPCQMKFDDLSSEMQ